MPKVASRLNLKESGCAMEKYEIAARLSRIELMLKGLRKRMDAIDESIHELAVNMAATTQLKEENTDHSD